MATNNIGNHKHLTLADRAAIEHGIQIGENFTQIAQRLNKDSSTISKAEETLRMPVLSFLFRLFSLKGSHYLIFTLPINILSIVPSVHCITTLIMDILLLSIWTSPAKYAIKSVTRPEKLLKTPATVKTGHTIILKNILKNIQTQML